MRTHLVVVLAPILHFRTRVVKRQEPVRVEALGPEPPVEGFDKRIVRGFAGTREVQRDAFRISPQVHVAGDELRALVDPDRLRIAIAPADPLKRLNNVLSPIAEAWINDR